MKKRNLNAKKKIHNFYFEKLKDKRIKKIYLVFKKNLCKNYQSKFGVAISGGSDSMALAFLAKCHSIANNQNYYYFSVDHKIRLNSTNEANQTKNKLKKYGINCQILTWKNNRIKSNLQAKARAMRYHLIFEECIKNKVNILLTAHQTDDLYENFFIRLLRGSGLKGLSSFQDRKSKISKESKVFILRPLLNISKSDLAYITKKTFNFNIEDPSNKNDKFLRIKIRKLINKLNQEGLSFKKFYITLENLKKSNNSIEFYIKKNIKDNSNFFYKKKSLIVSENFFQQPDEVVFRSFSELIYIFGNKKGYTRGKKVLRLIKNINSSKKLKKTTLSGCIFEKVNKSIIISREL